MLPSHDLQLYLASASPRRHELLRQLGYRFSVLTAPIEEQRKQGEKAQDYVCRLAREKAMAGLAIAPQSLPVLGADTIVVLGEQVLEKPADFVDAKAMLRALSGQVHQAMTAVALASKDRCDVRLVITNVAFRKLDDTEIEAYWHSGEPQDKAGAYGIQGIAGKFVSRIEGSYSAIVGLPLLETDLLIKHHLQPYL